jgi:hypothetical protein
LAGYSGTPLAKKLGIKERFDVLAVGAPAGYRKWLEPLPPAVRFVSKLTAGTQLVHLFTTRKSELARALADYRKRMAGEATIWVSWPKKAAKVRTDVTEDTIREVALPLGLVDVKVCAVDEVWSGLKLVIRKELR